MRFISVLILAAGLPAQSDIAMEQGKAVFRSNCAFCHGLNARGGRGPDLTGGQYTHGNTDDAIAKVVREGVPGSTMPAFGFDKEEMSAVVLYVRSLSRGSAAAQPVSGDAEHGGKMYDSSGCAACHAINGAGGIYGPDLSRIGASRSVEYLRQSIAEPSADIPPEYAGVSVTMRDGKKITGARVNEDNFSVQLRLQSGEFRMFQKSDIRASASLTESLMPSYTAMKKSDLDDLVAFLVSQRSSAPLTGLVKKAEGIK